MARLGKLERGILKLAIEAAISKAQKHGWTEGQQYLNGITLAFGKHQIDLFTLLRQREPQVSDRVIESHDTGKQVSRMFDGTIGVSSKNASPLASNKIYGSQSRVSKATGAMWTHARVFRSGATDDFTKNRFGAYTPAGKNAKARKANPEPLKPLNTRHGDKAAIDMPESQKRSVKAYEDYKKLKAVDGHKEIPKKYSDISRPELKPEKVTVTIDGKNVTKKLVTVARDQVILIPLLEEMGYMVQVQGKTSK